MKLMALALTAAVASSASAGLVGLQVTKTQFSNSFGNFDRYELFVQFNGSNDTLVNIGKLTRTAGAATNLFWHYDSNTNVNGVQQMRRGTRGGWNPNLINSSDVNASGKAEFDSYLTIGGYVGVVDPDDDYGGLFGNDTAKDASFSTGWDTGGALPGASNAGWFNSNPPGFQGRVGVGPNTATLVKIGQFIVDRDADGGSYTLRVNWNTGQPGGGQPESGPLAFNLPAPGAVALLGLAGLAGRRRR
jgi:hypothetical protein